MALQLPLHVGGQVRTTATFITASQHTQTGGRRPTDTHTQTPNQNFQNNTFSRCSKKIKLAVFRLFRMDVLFVLLCFTNADLRPLCCRPPPTHFCFSASLTAKLILLSSAPPPAVHSPVSSPCPPLSFHFSHRVFSHARHPPSFIRSQEGRRSMQVCSLSCELCLLIKRYLLLERIRCSLNHNLFI